MILRATSIGELAADQLRRSSGGEVSRVFRRSAYVETRGGLILLLQGELRSPMTVNVDAGAGLERLVAPGGRCRLGRGEMDFGRFSVDVREAGLYQSALLDPPEIDVLDSGSLTKAAGMLSLLYDVSPPYLNIVESGRFAEFVKSVALPAAHGEVEAAQRAGGYLPLVGLGGGFTPAGDDLVAGFLAAFNLASKSLGTRKTTLPWSGLGRRTVRESARILDYAQRGYVDEQLSKLILSNLSGSHATFRDDLLDVVRRGHTSGIDMSLGVTLASAVVADLLGRGGTTETMLGAISRLRTL